MKKITKFSILAFRLSGCFIIALLFLLSNKISAQGHDWWAANVGWDGKTHWSRYIISSPNKMGPNALPIPDLDDGRIQNEHALKFSALAHLGKGDHTFNPRLQLTYALVPERISFDLFMVPVEYFNMSHEKKNRATHFSCLLSSKIGYWRLIFAHQYPIDSKKMG